MTLEECLRLVGGFPFIAISGTGDKVEFLGKHRSGDFVGYSLRDLEYSKGWSMTHNEWEIFQEPLKWEGEVDAEQTSIYPIGEDLPEEFSGKRFKCVLTEIEGES